MAAETTRAFIFISFGGLLFGYIIGATGNAVTTGQLLCPEGWTGPRGSWSSVGYSQCYVFSKIMVGMLASLNLLGACLSSLICFKFADNIGRKLEVQIGAGLYFVGAGLAALVPTLWGVVAGFAVYGLGVGFSMHAAPIYIAESMPAKVRGFFISAKEVVIVFGIFTGFLVGAVFAPLEFFGWRLMIGLGMLLAVTMGVGISFVPESPRLLVLRELREGRSSEEAPLADKALESMMYFRPEDTKEEVAAELQTIRDELSSFVQSGDLAVSLLGPFRHPRPLVIGCGLVLLQQVTGQPSVLYFATTFFKVAGFGTGAAASAVIVGAVKVLATMCTAHYVDRLGRRPFLLIGIALMALSLATISVALTHRTCSLPGVAVRECNTSDIDMPGSWGFVTVIGLMLYVTGYQVGFGPIVWLLIAEVFPLSVRGSALSLAALVNFGSNLVVTLMHGVLMDALSPTGLFMLYLILCFVSFQFVHYLVPETRGKTLEEIEQEMTSRKGQ